MRIQVGTLRKLIREVTMTPSIAKNNKLVELRKIVRLVLEAPGNRYIPGRNAKGKIALPTVSALALWKDEILGQLSDGMWENSGPYGHYEFWFNMTPVLGAAKTYATESPAKNSYDLANLIPDVGDRMVKIGRLALASNSADFPRHTAEYMPATLDKFVAAQNGSDSYIADKLKNISLEIASKYYSTNYTERDLRQDLILIKNAMKNIQHVSNPDDINVAPGAGSASPSTGFAVVVGGVFRGKSKGPKGFKRFKPFKYSSAANRHPIVYAKMYPDEESAIAAAKFADETMEQINRSPYGGGYVKSWAVAVHDVANDKPVDWGGDSLSKKGYLYDGTDSSNAVLDRWGVLSATGESDVPQSPIATAIKQTSGGDDTGDTGPGVSSGSTKTYKIYGKKGSSPAHTRYKGKAYVAGSGTQFKNGDQAVVSPEGNKLKVKKLDSEHSQFWEPE